MQSDFTLAHAALALPEIYLTAMVCVVLMVDVFAGPGQRRPQALTALLDSTPAALQDAHPGLGRGA